MYFQKIWLAPFITIPYQKLHNYGIRLSHIYKIPSILNKKLVFQIKYLLF